MNPLESYHKIFPPDLHDFQRKFDLAAHGTGEPIRRLIVTLDPTLTSMQKPAWYRANQAEVFIGMNSARISELFSLAGVITCDAMPRQNKDGDFANNLRVWVREQDVKSASAMLSAQNWVRDVTPEKSYTIHTGYAALPRSLTAAI